MPHEERTQNPWLIGRAKGLAAGFWGVFICLCYVFFLLPYLLPRILCVICENPLMSEEEKHIGPIHLESHLVLPDLGAALGFCLVSFLFFSGFWFSARR